MQRSWQSQTVMDKRDRRVLHHTAKDLFVETDKNTQKGFILAQGARDSDTQSPAHVHGLNRDLPMVTFKAGC